MGVGFEANGKTGVKSYGRVGNIPPDSPRNLKWLLPIAVTNLAQSCCRIFKQEATACGVDIERKLSVDIFGEACTLVRNVSKEHTICFKISRYVHFYIALTDHAFMQFIWSWICLVNDCYILHAYSLDS